MPWSLRDGEIIEDPDGGSWTDAIKQQRHLRANETRLASMYAELDAQPDEDYGWEEPVQEVAPVVAGANLSPFAAELVGLILKDEREKSLTASLAQSMDAISERMAAEKEERTALVAALSSIGQPVINLPAPQVTVEAAPTPDVRVEVAAAEVNVPAAQITVEAPNVTVRPEIRLPEPAPVTKTITFERDPLTGQVSSADVTEG